VVLLFFFYLKPRAKGQKEFVMIITHFNVDLDAVAAVWAYCRFHQPQDIPAADVQFRSAALKAADVPQGAVVLDIDAEGVGVKGKKCPETGRVSSAFAELMQAAPVEVRDDLQWLVKYVDEQDSTGTVAHEGDHQASGLQSTFRAIGTSVQTDRALIDQMALIFDGHLEMAAARRRAIAEADEAFVSESGRVAVVVDSKEFATNGVLFDRGVEFVVFQDGNNLGVVRSRESKLHLGTFFAERLTVPEEEAAEWFAHSAGFLFCRGSRKAPAATPSAVQAAHLAAMLDQFTDEVCCLKGRVLDAEQIKALHDNAPKEV